MERMVVRRIVMFVFLMGFSVVELKSQDWELRKDESGVKIYTSPVEGSEMDAFKGIITINTSVDQLVNALKKVNSFPEWMPDCAKAELLSSTGDEQYHYTLTEAPFPVSDRDAVVHYRFTNEGESIKIVVVGAPDYIPSKEDIVRIPFLEGYWLLEPVTQNQTIVTYQLHADPGGSVPSWLANATAVDSPYSTLQSLKSYVE